MNIAYSDRKKVYLDTGLSETGFSRSVSGVNFSESGIYTKFYLFDNNIQFKEWSFQGTTVKDEKVFFEGENAGGKNALEIILSHNEEEKARLTYALISALSKAIETKTRIPSVGLGGILYSEKPGKSDPDKVLVELLFLPENIFDLCASNHDEKNYANLQGFWQNKQLSNNNALIFLQSVLAYYTLSKVFPFMKTETDARQEDITDSNFIEIENMVNGISPALALNINMGFHIDNQYEREKSLIDLKLLQKELGLSDDGIYTKVIRDTKISDSDFEKRASKKAKKQELKTIQKRIFKRYATAIILILAAIAIISNLAYKTHLENLEMPCAKNLSPKESIETFYSGFHNLDSNLMSLVAKNGTPRDLIKMVSNVYVTQKTREAFEAKNASLTPELWLTRPELMNYWVFGITDFRINGESAYNRFKPQTRKEVENIKKQTSEINASSDATQSSHSANGTSQTFNVTYNFIYTGGKDTPITIDRCNATVVCTYQKDQWYLTDININHNEEQLSQNDFKNEYLLVLKEKNDAKNAVSALREKYNWLPDDRAMDEGKNISEYQKNYFNQ